MHPKIDLSERNLTTNVRDVSHEILHDLYVVCRKAAIYTAGHPIVSGSLSRPFLSLQKVFGLKQYFSLVLAEGHLFANNIQLTNNPAVEYLKERMHDLEVTSLLLENRLTTSDLLAFIDRFVRRLPTSSPDYYLERHLENHKVFSVLVNGDLSRKLFDTGLRYRDDVREDFSARSLIANYFSGDLDLAVKVLGSHFEDTGRQAAEVGIDYYVELVAYILPEKFAQLAPAALLGMADQILTESAALNETASEKLARLVRSFEYHPKRDQLLEEMGERFAHRGVDTGRIKQSLSPSGSQKLEAVQTVDQVCRRIFSDEFDRSLYDEFHDAFIRLVRTRQLGKAAGIAEIVIGRLGSDTAAFRQQAIYLLQDMIKSVLSLAEYDFLDVIMRHLQAQVAGGWETFEVSEVVMPLVKAMLALRRYESVATFLNILKAGRHADRQGAVYDSAAVKRIFDELSNPESVSRLVAELKQEGNTQIKPVRDILTALQSEEVALQLAGIVAHPQRAVRQHALKILSELGWPALHTLAQVLSEEANFQRPSGRHELPDEKWYLVRNAIFVLGNLRDPLACQVLRLRLSDPDVRVRREIVGALEKIGGDEATDLLMILADDSDASIRDAAIIALGLFNQRDLAPFFIDLMSRQRGEMARIITALASAGAPEGHEFLESLLNDDEKLKPYASGKGSMQDIRRWIADALAKKAADGAAKRPMGAADQQSETADAEKESTLSKTARLLLNKIQPKK